MGQVWLKYFFRKIFFLNFFFKIYTNHPFHTETTTKVNVWWMKSGGTDGEKFIAMIEQCAREILDLAKSMA